MRAMIVMMKISNYSPKDAINTLSGLTYFTTINHFTASADRITKCTFYIPRQRHRMLIHIVVTQPTEQPNKHRCSKMPVVPCENFSARNLSGTMMFQRVCWICAESIGGY